MDRLSDGYLVRTSESLYSVQSMANIRIRSIFDSSNTLVNRLGPTLFTTDHQFQQRMDVNFINAIAAIIVVECYIIHCRLARTFSSVNKHTYPLAIISMPIDDNFNSEYLVNLYNNNVITAVRICLQSSVNSLMT